MSEESLTVEQFEDRYLFHEVREWPRTYLTSDAVDYTAFHEGMRSHRTGEIARKNSTFHRTLRDIQFGEGRIGRKFRGASQAAEIAEKLKHMFYEGFAYQAEEIRQYDNANMLFRAPRDGYGTDYIIQTAIRLEGRTFFGVPIGLPLPSVQRFTSLGDEENARIRRRERAEEFRYKASDPEWKKALDFTELMMRRMFMSEFIYSDENTVHWVERFGHEQGAYKWRSASWSKFLKGMRHKFGLDATDEAIQEFSEIAGVALAEPKVRIIEAGPNRVTETYRERYFGSCMQNSPATYFYNNQPPENLGILRCEDADTGELMGRALIWYNAYDITNKKYNVALDRIYPSDNGVHIDKMIQYAEEKGWYYKEIQAIGTSFAPNPVRMRVVVHNDEINYPYMDTFQYSPYFDDDDTVKLYNFQSDLHDVPWDFTDGRHPANESQNHMICEHCENPMHEDDAFHTIDGYVCPHCREEWYIENIDGEYVHIEDDYWVTPDNIDVRVRDEDCAYNNTVDEFYYIGRIPRWLRGMQRFEVTHVTAGQYEGEYFAEHYVVEYDGEYWYREDEELAQAMNAEEEGED